MTTFRAFFLDLAQETLRNPAGAAARLMALNPSMEARWLAVCLVAVISVVETQIILLAMPATGQGGFLGPLADPWFALPMQVASIVIIAGAITFFGRLFGGTGKFADALMLFAWIEFLMTVAQMVQLFTMALLPGLGALVGMAVLAAFLWLVVQFILALHGFQSPLKVFIGVIFGFLALAIIFSLAAGMLGVEVQL